MDGVTMRSRYPREVGFQIQFQSRAQILGVEIGRRTVVTVIHPKYRDVGLRLHRKVKDRSFVRAEISRNDRAARRLGYGPADDLKR